MPQSSSDQFVREIIGYVKERGGNQKTLAAQAGIPESVLSQMKGNDDAKLSSLSKLAAAAGLRLTLVPDDDLAERIVKGDLL